MARSKNPSEAVFHSVTPGMYATIPSWALANTKLKTAKCYHYNRRKSIVVPLDELRQLRDEGKIWISVNEETGGKYITSKVWRKYF